MQKFIISWSYFMFAKNRVQHDQGGAIGLAFKLVVKFFLVVRVLEIVVKFVVVRTYARTLKRY